MSRGWLLGQFETLADRYPTALSRVRSGAECGPGWIDLVIPVLEACETHAVAIAQIKQKFGGLRIYTYDRNLIVAAAIAEAEEASFRTCEQCGAPGRKRPGGWIETLCDACAVKP